MPIIKSAIKRVKQATKAHQRNSVLKKDIKKAIKELIANPSSKALSAAQSRIDTAVKKGLIKKNTAARKKSNIAKIAKEAGVKLEKAAPKAKTTTKKTPAKTVAKKPVTKKPVAKKATAKTATKKPAAKKAPAKKPAAKKTK